MMTSSKKQHYFSKPSNPHHHHCSATVTTPETDLESNWPSSSSSSMSEYGVDDGRRKSNRSSSSRPRSSFTTASLEDLLPPVRAQPVHPSTKKDNIAGSRSKSMGPSSSNNMRRSDAHHRSTNTTSEMVHSSSSHHHNSRPRGPTEGSRGMMRRDESHRRPHPSSSTDNNRPRRTSSCPPSPQQQQHERRRGNQPSSRMSSNHNYDRPHQVSQASRGQHPTSRNNDGRVRAGPTSSSSNGQQLIRRLHSSSSNREHPTTQQQKNDNSLALVVRERTPSRTTPHRTQEEKNNHQQRERREEEHQQKNQAQKNLQTNRHEEEQQQRRHCYHREYPSSSRPRHRSVPPPQEKKRLHQEQKMIEYKPTTTTIDDSMSTKALPSRRHTVSSNNKKNNWVEVKSSSDAKSRDVSESTKSSKKSHWGEVKCDNTMISSSNNDYSTKSKSQSEHKKTTTSSGKSSRDVLSKSSSGVEGTTKSLYSKEDMSRVISELTKEDNKSKVSDFTKETSRLFRANNTEQHSPPTREKSWISCASDEESFLVNRPLVTNTNTTTKKHDSLVAAHRAKARQLDVSMRTKSTKSSSIRGSLRSQESKGRDNNEHSIFPVKESLMHDSPPREETTAAAQDQEAKRQDFFELALKIIAETKDKKMNSRSKSSDAARSKHQRSTPRHEPVKERKKDTWRDESNVELAMRLIEKNKGTKKMSRVKSSDEEDMHVRSSSSRSRSKSRHSDSSPPRHEKSKALRRVESPSSSRTNSPPRPVVVHDTTPLRFIPQKRIQQQLPTSDGIPEPTFNENSLKRRESGPAYSSKPIPPPPSRRITVAGPGGAESALTSMRTPAIPKSPMNLMMNSPPPPPPPPRINRYNNNNNNNNNNNVNNSDSKTNQMLYSASEPSFATPPLPLLQPRGEISDHNQSDYLNQYPDAADIMPDTSKEWLKYATKGSQRRQEAAADDGSTTNRKKSKMFGRKKSGIEEQVKAMSVKQMPFTDQFGDFGYYSGQVNDDGKPDGTGIMKYENGVFYEGTWTNGCQDKLAASQYERIRGGFTSWSGKGKGGVKSGSTLPWNAKNNDKHSNEKVNVRGMEWTDLNGDTGRYTGEVDDDQLPHGSGIMKYDFGLIAEGDWVHGVLREGPMDRIISAAAMNGGGSVSPGMMQISSGMSVGPGVNGFNNSAVSVLSGGGAMSVAPMGFGRGPVANGFNNSAVSVFSGGGAPSPVQFMHMNPSQRAYIAQQNAIMKSSMHSIMSSPSGGSVVYNGAGSVYGGAGSVYGNSGSFYESVNSGMQMQPMQPAQYQQQMAMMQQQQMVLQQQQQMALQQQYQCQQQYQPQNLHEEVDMPMKPPVPNIVIR